MFSDSKLGSVVKDGKLQIMRAEYIQISGSLPIIQYTNKRFITNNSETTT